MWFLEWLIPYACFAIAIMCFGSLINNKFARNKYPLKLAEMKDLIENNYDKMCLCLTEVNIAVSNDLIFAFALGDNYYDSEYGDKNNAYLKNKKYTVYFKMVKCDREYLREIVSKGIANNFKESVVNNAVSESIKMVDNL